MPGGKGPRPPIPPPNPRSTGEVAHGARVRLQAYPCRMSSHPIAHPFIAGSLRRLRHRGRACRSRHFSSDSDPNKFRRGDAWTHSHEKGVEGDLEAWYRDNDYVVVETNTVPLDMGRFTEWDWQAPLAPDSDRPMRPASSPSTSSFTPKEQTPRPRRATPRPSKRGRQSSPSLASKLSRNPSWRPSARGIYSSRTRLTKPDGQRDGCRTPRA
jgi:hypothetical protein